MLLHYIQIVLLKGLLLPGFLNGDTALNCDQFIGTYEGYYIDDFIKDTVFTTVLKINKCHTKSKYAYIISARQFFSYKNNIGHDPTNTANGKSGIIILTKHTDTLTIRHQSTSHAGYGGRGRVYFNDSKAELEDKRIDSIRSDCTWYGDVMVEGIKLTSGRLFLKNTDTTSRK